MHTSLLALLAVAGTCTALCIHLPPLLTCSPSAAPTRAPTSSPSAVPTTATPSAVPTSAAPTEHPTDAPSDAPTDEPSEAPTEYPTDAPTEAPTDNPTEAPSDEPSGAPTDEPTEAPTDEPTGTPTDEPSWAPTFVPSGVPTRAPTETPSAAPTSWLAAVPRASSLRAHVSFGASSPLADATGHGHHLATVDARTLSADCSQPPCFVRLDTDTGAGLVAPAGLGASGNGTTVCLRYRVWGPAEGTGAVLVLSPEDSNAPSKGSVKYWANGAGAFQMWTISDSSGLSDWWGMAPAANASSPHSHVCLSWFLYGSAGYVRHRLVVDNTTFPLLCPGADGCAAESTVPMVSSETVACIGCVGYPEVNRQTAMDVSMFAVWDTALTPEELRAYIDLAATAPQ